jgi:hypothetical protein
MLWIHVKVLVLVFAQKEKCELHLMMDVRTKRQEFGPPHRVVTICTLISMAMATMPRLNVTWHLLEPLAAADGQNVVQML